jgi:hypothetical protein
VSAGGFDGVCPRGRNRGVIRQLSPAISEKGQLSPVKWGKLPLFYYLNNFESTLSMPLVICLVKSLSLFAEDFLYSSKNFLRMRFLFACRF